jgi:hypothetical protein
MMGRFFSKFIIGFLSFPSKLRARRVGLLRIGYHEDLGGDCVARAER